MGRADHGHGEVRAQRIIVDRPPDHEDGVGGFPKSHHAAVGFQKAENVLPQDRQQRVCDSIATGIVSEFVPHARGTRPDGVKSRPAQARLIGDRRPARATHPRFFEYFRPGWSLSASLRCDLQEDPRSRNRGFCPRGFFGRQIFDGHAFYSVAEPLAQPRTALLISFLVLLPTPRRRRLAGWESREAPPRSKH